MPPKKNLSKLQIEALLGGDSDSDDDDLDFEIEDEPEEAQAEQGEAQPLPGPSGAGAANLEETSDDFDNNVESEFHKILSMLVSAIKARQYPY